MSEKPVTHDEVDAAKDVLLRFLLENRLGDGSWPSITLDGALEMPDRKRPFCVAVCVGRPAGMLRQFIATLPATTKTAEYHLPDTP